MAEESTNKPNARRSERIGKYEIVGHIATGGMGVIYKARDADLDRLVALKILPPDLAQKQTTLIRFYREARAAARLRHENIVTLYDVGESNGTHFIALEYIEGTDLQDYITRKCKLDPDEARQIIIQAARALAAAHEQGIVHRDIKPSNFLLTRKGERLIVKLTDFGLAIRSENDAEFRITKDKTTVGTVDYMSPEQARDSRAADIRSDIYSLGCTFFHMLAGQAPFAKGTLPERLIHHMKTPALDVRKLNKLVPDYLAAIINRMLAKKPDDRYQTPADLLHDLENPDRVAVPDKRGSVAGELEGGQGHKQPRDPTQVIENEDLDAEEETPRQVKTSRARKKVSQPVEEEADEREDEETPPSAARDEPWEPDPDEAAPPKDAETAKNKPGKSSPVWMWALAGSAGVLVLVLLGAFLFSGKTAPVNKEPDRPPAPPEPIAIKNPEPRIEKPKTVVWIDTSPAKMTVVLRGLPSMGTPPEKADQAALRREYYGPFTAFPEPPKGATVLRMSRLAADGPDAFRTLANAFEKAKPGECTVIEVYDNGPIYVPSLAAGPERDIVLRGADGYRPLLVWEGPKKSAGAFCTLTQGKLILDNLDLVMQWSDKAPAALFDLEGTDWYARDCTFSVAGEAPKDGEGVALMRRRGAEAEKRPAQTWLKRCYVRGADLSLVRSQEATSVVLVEDSLVVGYQHPLFDVRARDQDAFDVYCVRSSLIAGQVLLRCRSEQKGASPKVAVHVLDSILSRVATTFTGDMIQMAEGANPSKLSWRAANSVYAGWRQLLESGSKSIAYTDREAWHQQWGYLDSDFDHPIRDSWPDAPPSGLAEQTADLFRPKYLPLAMEFSPVAYIALTGAGSIGCAIGRLPPAPREWINRTLRHDTVRSIPNGVLAAPPIENAGDLYGGERIELAKVRDLGKYLTDKLKKVKPAPRVVIHLAGKGTFQTSTLHVNGVQNLVLYCEPNFNEPITLEENSAANVAKVPLIAMTGGHLEVIGARLRLGASTLVPTIVHVQDGDLSLTRCWLLGPHTKTAGPFKNLITMTSAGPEPATLLLSENVLVASKLLLKLQDHVQLHARNNVFLGLGDGVHFETPQSTVHLKHVLDHNTWAVRQSFFTLKPGPEFPPVTLHANSNAFLQPFAEDADKGALLRGAEGWVASGSWNWRGRFNVYDPRMPSYFTGLERTAGRTQTQLDWQAAWGQFGEHEPRLLPAAAAKMRITAEAATQPELLAQLNRLALPIELRGDGQTPPGADLGLLGIKKK